jgi:spore maturation protein CgeB
LLKLLDKDGYLKVVGKPGDWDFLTNGYMGKSTKSTVDYMRGSGMVLILHAPDYMIDGVPSPRIFEAAASGAIAITDRHPFIMREFGDSVLYVDHNLPVREMYEQIVQHIRWIKEHGKEANLMAQKAHQIFLDKFTLDKQLETIVNTANTKYQN